MPPSRRRTQPVHEEAEQDVRQDHASSGAETESEAGESAGENENSNESANQLLAKKLVRYALSCEYSRTPIRREGIKERVLGNRPRTFQKVFTLAQQQLRTVLGMEFRELPVREKTSLQEKRKAMKSKAQLKTGSGTYILTSTLPAAYRAADIIPPSRVPDPESEATYLAFYTLVVSLIWLSGGELTEPKLMRHLLRLNADKNLASEKTELTLKRMDKQGYVMRKEDRPPLGQEGEKVVSWVVGPRGKEEIGLDGVMGFVREVYGEQTEELDRKLRISLRIKQPLPVEEEDGDVPTTT